MKSFVSPQQTSSSSSFYPDVNKIRSEQKFSRIYAIKPTIHATDTVYLTMLRLKEEVSAQIATNVRATRFLEVLGLIS